MTELRELEPDFWRAPSAHNTQPWTLTYTRDGAVVGWDPARALPVSDPTGRDLRLGLGAFVETCLIVAAGAGLALDYHPDPGHPEPHRIGVLRKAATPYQTPFTAADVRARGANRGPYHPGALPGEVAGELTGLLPPGADLRRVPSRELAVLLHAADVHQFADPEVTAELRDWLRLTPRHPRYRMDGLTDKALALSGMEALGLRAALAAYPALRRAGLPRILAAASKGVLDYDGEVLVLVGPPERQVEMGRVLMRQWLTLSTRGYTTHPLSQIIDSPPTRALLAAHLGIDDPERLLHIARAGRPVTPAPRSARITD
ncbi:nitroreductase [Nonomuraea typhae]|uniref:nitroreductase n=1 Tax=Nonomuraea typhae TaxID=2603600 RepID=UPI0012F9C9F8|nr:nitroreductase [Nonomuraea typhae]